MKTSQEKKWLINGFALVVFVAASIFAIANTPQIAESEKTQFLNLSNADIDHILAVKAKIQTARIQASLSF